MSRWVVCGIAGEKDEASTVRVAARLSEHIGARLAIVAVAPEQGTSEQVRAQLSAGGGAIARVARTCHVVDDAVHRVEFGDPADALARVGDELDASLVVVGATRRSALRAMLSTSVPARLLATVDRPVVVVRKGADRAFHLDAGLDAALARQLGLHSSDGADPERASAKVVGPRGRGRIARALAAARLPRGGRQPVVVLPEAHRARAAA